MGERPVAQPQASLSDAEWPTTILLIRHGRSADVVPGSPEAVDPPLHDEGQHQAELLGKRLSSARIDAIYASDYRRAQQTAAAIAQHHPAVDVVTDPQVREIGLGDWDDGEFRRRAAARDPEFLEFAQAGRWELIPGAEKDDDFKARVMGALERIATDHADQRVAVVCHGGVIEIALSAVLGLYRSTFMPIDNAGITVLRRRTEPIAVWLVTHVNDVTHLRDPAL